MKNILITGGAGFIGSHVAYKLAAEGYNVRVLVVEIKKDYKPNLFIVLIVYKVPFSILFSK